MRRHKRKSVIIGFYKRLNEILPQIKKTYSIEALFCTPHMNEQNKCLVISSEINTVSEISDLKNIVIENKVTSIIFSLDFYSNEDLLKIFSCFALNFKLYWYR